MRILTDNEPLTRPPAAGYFVSTPTVDDGIRYRVAYQDWAAVRFALHGARYDWQTAPLEEKGSMKARYDELTAQAAQEFGCTEMGLRLAVRDDYHLWRKRNQLPKPPSP